MTKKEKEILTKIKNKYTPIVLFFKLWEQVINDTSLTTQQRQDMYQMINKEQNLVSENVKEIQKLLKEFK
jgi:hypothetical protein